MFLLLELPLVSKLMVVHFLPSSMMVTTFQFWVIRPFLNWNLPILLTPTFQDQVPISLAYKHLFCLILVVQILPLLLLLVSIFQILPFLFSFEPIFLDLLTISLVYIFHHLLLRLLLAFSSLPPSFSSFSLLHYPFLHHHFHSQILQVNFYDFLYQLPSTLPFLCQPFPFEFNQVFQIPSHPMRFYLLLLY